MATLILGVVDVAYTQTEPNGSTKRATTGEVAEVLEKTYSVMQTFFDRRQKKIADLLADSLAHAIEARVAGHRGGSSPTFEAEQRIEAEFRAFLDSNEMNIISKLTTGAPISKSADRGISHRKKHPYAGKNPSRPAFVDTGLYRISFRAVVSL